jgi:hypothetical protein
MPCMVRTALHGAADARLSRATRSSALSGPKRAKVAPARKLAAVRRRVWVDGTTFRWGEGAATAA